MTIFVGAINLTGIKVSDSECRSLKSCAFSVLSIDKFDTEFRHENLYLMQYDVKAFSVQNYIDKESNVTAIAGQPILTKSSGDLHGDINLIHDNPNQIGDILKSSQGTFSGLHFNAKEKTLCIFTDKIGIRPVFYCEFNLHLYFSSNLSCLVEHLKPNLSIDKDGLKEHCSLGFSIGNKTYYKQIKRLCGGELLNSSESESIRSKYWHWDKLKVAQSKSANTTENLFNLFNDAVNVRDSGQKQVYSFLSGGLDSRAVTSILRTKNKHVHAFNFQQAPCQDTVFSKLYAEKAGIELHSKFIPKEKFRLWAGLISEQIAEYEGKKVGQIVWSGDGGAPLGGVYLSQKILDTIETDIEKGIESYLTYNKKEFPLGLYDNELETNNNDWLVDNIRDVLLSYDLPADKALFCFLLLHGQARILQYYFESIHDHKIEMALPFFDSHFVEQLFEFNVQELLNHHAYMDWFNYFPEFTRESPWQTYPGHLDCPIKLKNEFTDQWSIKNSKSFSTRLKETNEILSSTLNPTISELVKTPNVIAKSMLHLFGIADYTYLRDLNTRLSKIYSSLDGNKNDQ